MPVGLEVEGADKLAVVARALRDVGDKELRRELYRGLNRAVKPLTADVKAATPDYLPKRYARELSKSLRVKTRRRAGGRNPAIFLVGSAKTPRGKDRDLSSLNRGRLRHPLFGNRRFWYDQPVRKDWWTDPLIQGAPEVREEIVRVLDDVARQLVRRI